jgi:hypothetical protein
MTSKILLISGITLASAASGFAQDSQQDVHHYNVIVGVGPAIPVGNTTNYLSTAPMFKVGFGYRFNRWFQGDVGLQLAFGAANNQNAEISEIGPVQGGDHEFMVPLGGRFIIPNPFKKIEVSAGGGAAYLHYSETIPNAGQIGINCYSCTSRGGWGGYGLANARYFLNDSHNFSVGTTLQFIAASTNGQAVASIPAIATTDHWVNLTFEFGLSF